MSRKYIINAVAATFGLVVHDTVVSRGIGKERGQVTADGGRRTVENSSVGAGGATAEECCRDNHQSTPGEPAGRAEGLLVLKT